MCVCVCVCVCVCAILSKQKRFGKAEGRRKEVEGGGGGTENGTRGLTKEIEIKVKQLTQAKEPQQDALQTTQASDKKSVASRAASCKRRRQRKAQEKKACVGMCHVSVMSRHVLPSAGNNRSVSIRIVYKFRDAKRRSTHNKKLEHFPAKKIQGGGGAEAKNSETLSSF